MILDRCGLSVRLIVVDLDNTLWGGVATDDGIEGVALGGDYPGNAHRDFQLLLKSLSQCGIGLAVASKNDADVAWEIIDRHRKWFCSGMTSSTMRSTGNQRRTQSSVLRAV
nr:HAD-IIIC family phosphatase [Erwinia rhapontici]